MWWMFALGVLVGSIVSLIFRYLNDKPKDVGMIRLDRSDPDNPYLFLELEPDGMQKLKNSNRVTMGVNLENYISQR